MNEAIPSVLQMSSISDVSMTDFGGRKEGYGGILIGVAAICLFTSKHLM